MLDLGKRIKEILRRRGIKQSELAVEMGKTKQSLNSALNRPNVGSEWIMMIMEQTGITAAEIFGEKGLSYEPLKESGPLATADPMIEYQAPSSPSVLLQRIEKLEQELRLSQKDVEHLKQQLEEKERLIQVLMGNKSA